MHKNFRIKLLHMSAVLHGADHSAQVRRADARDGRSFAVKLTSAGSVAGLVAPHLLAGAGSAGIPAMSVARDGRIWSERDGRRLSVAAWVDGPLAADVDLTAAQWQALGRLLRRVHDAP